ncbi:DUF6323 family protein [Lachnospiraceae bacterium KK002]
MDKNSKGTMSEYFMEAGRKIQISNVLETNRYTEKFGLTLTPEDVELLVAEQKQTLKEQKRVEFSESILPKIIYEFCDSDYITMDNYTETIIRLQEIFYHYKNEMLDEITDTELLHFMKEQFETVCSGDPEYLEGTCLNIFAQAIRAGYRGYEGSDGYAEYEQFDEVQRWDREVYLYTLYELLS